MKTLMKLALIGTMLTATPVMAQKLPAATVVLIDMDQVVNSSIAGRTAAAEIQARITALQGRSQTLQNQLKTEATAIQAGEANKSLTGAALETRAKAFGQRQQAAQVELQAGEQGIQASRQYVIKQLTEAADPIIARIMRERGASIVMTAGATLQHTAGLDITDAVVAAVNTSLPRVSSTPPLPSAAKP